MKYLLSLIFIYFTIALTSYAQRIDSKYLVGDWNRINKEKIKKTDTLVFSIIRSDSTFRYWKFKDSGEVTISNGFEGNYNKNKYIAVFAKENFNWVLDSQNLLVTIKNEKKNECYKILELTEHRLVLLRND